jgi:hypothetical protein
MPKYMLLIYGDEKGMANVTPEQLQQEYDAYAAYTQEIKDRGAWVAGEGLDRTSTATTVRVKNGETLTTDGPFAETKEQLAGYMVLECADLGEAVGWAEKLPFASGSSVEVRPLVDPG